MARLVVHEPSGVATALALEGEVRIGRDPGLELALADSKASRHHATISQADGRWIVVDSSSRHGTFVNGERVTRRELADGDQLQIGSTRLRFELADPPATVELQVTGDAPPPDDPRLRVFYELADAAAAIDDGDAALRPALAAIVAVLGCDRGVIALGETPPKLRRVADVNANDLVIARGVIDAVLSRGEAVLLRGAEAARQRTLDRQGIRSAIAAPLRVRERVIGLVYVDDRGRDDRFEPADVELLVSVARLAGVIVDVATRYDRVVAAVEVAERERVAPDLIGSSAVIERVRRDVARFADTDLPIHLTGESGAGKELVARALHTASPRRTAQFVAVNCAALPDGLLESELFGHVRGAFTGADKTRRGKLVLADKGTLFLDEVADLTLAAQAKLLRVLEDGEVVPVGSEHATRIDLRVVSASHKNLADAVAKQQFRQDLYYRLVGTEIEIPPLRERGRDVVELAQAFLVRVRARRHAPRGFAPDALDALTRYGWPGNVRELRHAVERAAAIAGDDLIAAADLSLRPPSGKLEDSRDTLANRYAALDHNERVLVREAMARANNNIAEAARQLGITRIMMKRRLDRFADGDE
jgi:Nif-specific regulatory protein